MQTETNPMVSISRIVQDEMIRNGLAEDWVHGLLHIDRVIANWKWLVFKCDKIDPRMARMLQVAGYFHDVKKNDVTEYKDHAEAGAAFFLSQEIPGFTEEETEAIAFAIRYHNVGLKKLGLRADSRKHILLQLLCIIDGMDSVCYIGYYRVLGWYGQQGEKFDLFGGYSAEALENLLNGDFTDGELEELKDNGSVLPHLIYNLKIFRGALDPVMDLLSVDFLIEVERRMSKSRKEIEKMIKLKRRNERPMVAFQ